MYTLITILLLSLAITYWHKSVRLKRTNSFFLNERDQISFILENLSDGLIEYDTEMAVVRMNRAAEKIFGIPAVDLVRKKIEQEPTDPKFRDLSIVTFPKIGENSKLIKDDSVAQGAVRIEEISTPAPNERKLKVYTITRVFNASGSVSGSIKFIRDVTKEESVSQAKSDLVAVVAHQLRTPLSGIKWVFTSLLGGDFGPLTDEQKKFLTQGEEANEGLLGLVEDILDVSRIEEGRVEYKFETVDLAAFMRSLADSFIAEAKEKNISLALDLPSEKVLVPFDQKRIRLALGNLIDNAIAYSDKDTTIAIGLKKEADTVVMSVRDSGIGIPEEAKKKLFGKFFRADNAVKVRTRGTGLGLFLAKSIAESHGGNIRFESEVGKGTTFFITLPLTAKTSEKAPAAAPVESHVYGI